MVAARYYLMEGAEPSAPPTAPAYSTDWTSASGHARRIATEEPDGSALANAGRNDTLATVVRLAIRQYVLDGRLGAGTASGTLELAIRTSISNVAANAKSYVVARILSADGLTVRGVLYSGPVGIAYGTTMAVYSQGTVALTPVVAQAGDKLVFEVGVLYDNTSATSYTSQTQVGAPIGTPDLANVNGTTTANRPWVEFSNLPLMRMVDVSGTTVDVLGEPPAPTGLLSALWMEALGTQLAVEASMSALWVEAMGTPRAVEAALTGTWLEVLGTPGTPPEPGGDGLMNVARTGVLRVKHPDGTWQTPIPLVSA